MVPRWVRGSRLSDVDLLLCAAVRFQTRDLERKISSLKGPLQTHARTEHEGVCSSGSECINIESPCSSPLLALAGTHKVACQFGIDECLIDPCKGSLRYSCPEVGSGCIACSD